MCVEEEERKASYASTIKLKASYTSSLRPPGESGERESARGIEIVRDWIFSANIIKVFEYGCAIALCFLHIFVFPCASEDKVILV